MTPEEYVAKAEAIQAGVVGLIDSVVNAETANLSKVLDRDPVSFDESEWLGALRSDVDMDEAEDKRIHAWIVTFVTSDDLVVAQVRSIAPKFHYRVQFFYTHDFGTAANNSHKRAQAEVLKVQFAFSQTPKLVPGTKHDGLPVKIPLRRFSKDVVHYGDTEIVFENDPINVY